MFEQIKDAILPPAGLRDALSNWHKITAALSDTLLMDTDSCSIVAAIDEAD